ncbi:deoxyribonuclease-2-alpha [Zophobas morio]|uniref:deoxyribonuclease-2-alpha n=1 Tax=Zophobas morio TaxID=2755281 RepID=UPI003083129D
MWGCAFTFYIQCLYIFSGHAIITIAIQCRDDNNQDVDWFAVYKIPKMTHENHLIKDGLAYTYVTSENYSQWTLSQYSVNDSRSMIGNTLNPFYSEKKNLSYVLYNDQPPNEPSKPYKGHTKGVILADVDGGLWLVHSVPHFLPLSSKYEYSPTGTVKGQSFLCISLDLKNLNKVGIQLQYNEPQIYASYIEEILDTKLSHIVDAVSGTVVTKPPWYNEITINSKSGVQFISFAKTKQFGKDLYHDWIAPALHTDLFVETWLNGVGELPSNCSNSVSVWNVNIVGLPVTDVSFRNTEDHSKWAVSVLGPWTCIGDINRMNHQKFRGGGSVCLNNQKLAKIYLGCVEAFQKCISNFL